jgi:hypothetical protein
MTRQLVLVYSMRVSLVESALTFLGLREEIVDLHKQVREALVYGALSELEEVVDRWERRMFDDPKTLDFSNTAGRVHSLFSDAL